ncbi:MAG TPA: nitroreductase [Desulfomonilia bacterium]|nr:nitroreductase [Desulfomonilia bacterium]
MNVTDAVNARFTCRAFTPEPVDELTIRTIIKTALKAPSWGNTQPWEIFVANGESADRLRKAYSDRFADDVAATPDLLRPLPKDWPPALKERYDRLRNDRSDFLGLDRDDQKDMRSLMVRNFCFFDAPCVLFLCMDRTLTHWSLFDLGSLSQSIMLIACEQGLGTAVAVQLASYPDLVRQELGIPENLAVCIGIAIGHIDASSPQNKFRSTRRPVDEVVRIRG